MWFSLKANNTGSVSLKHFFFFGQKYSVALTMGKIGNLVTVKFFQRHKLFGLKPAEFSKFKFLNIFWAFLNWASYLNRPFRESSHVGRGWQWVVLVLGLGCFGSRC